MYDTVQFDAVTDEPAIAFATDRLRDATIRSGLGWGTGGRQPYRVGLTVEADADADRQGYRIDRTEGGCTVIAGGRAGALYGLLRIAETVRADGPAAIADEQKTPYLPYRGIKFNAPLDARTPGYSDDGDSAAAAVSDLWSFDFWRSLLDRMATERYNLLSLWNLHPFPSMVRVPEYPDVALDDVMVSDVRPVAHTTGVGMVDKRTRESLRTVATIGIDDKIDFWRRVMAHAHDRCIEIMIFTWNVFSYGTDHTSYGIDDRMDNPVTIDYTRASVRALLRTYPLLAGIGITAGEHMDRSEHGARRNQAWLRSTYGAALQDIAAEQPDRRLRLIHRSHWSDLQEVSSVFDDVGLPAEFSYKYSSAHLHTTTEPPYIHRDGFLDQLPAGARFWLTVRDDDYYLLRPGDPAFVRDYLRRLPSHARLNGFYLGPDGYTIGREQLRLAPTDDRELVFDRQWYLFAMFGQLGFDPHLTDGYFRDRLRVRYPAADPATLDDAWRAASMIIPAVNTFHFEGNKFDLDWYPEACLSHPRQRHGFHTVHDFIAATPLPGSGLLGIVEDCRTGGADGIRPGEVADRLDRAATSATAAAERLRAAADPELIELLDDIVDLAELGCYYADKIRGAAATHRVIAGTALDEDARQQAVTHLENASDHWARYAGRVHRRYRPQRLSRLGGRMVDLRDLQHDVDYDITLARAVGYDEHR
ncbi:hypothetical protein [Microlunatus soli]|nr:hypothetical protein [Microlunatus soli]